MKKTPKTNKHVIKKQPKKLQHFARLRELDPQYSISAALLLVERMMINGDIFLNAENNSEKVNITRDILEQLWTKLHNRKSRLNIEAVQSKLEELFVENNSNSIAAQSYNDCIVALGICADAFCEKDTQAAVNVAKLSQGDIERYLEAAYGRDVRPDEFREHELVCYELSVLDSMLDFFQVEKPNNNSIKEMRMVMADLGVSNLGLSLTGS